MRIAWVVPGGVDRTGDHRVIPCLLWLIERLAAQGHDLHVFALDQEPGPGQWPLRGAEIHNVGMRPRRLRAVAGLIGEHRKRRFDIVHAFWAAGPGAAAAAFGRWAGIPVVLTLPGGDLAALKDIGYGGLLTLRNRVVTRLAIAGADRVIVPSRWMVEHAAAVGVRATEIPFGVAIDRWPVAPPRRRLLGEPVRLLHVANLNRVKDQETLLRAARALQERGVNFRLDVIGYDTLEGTVQQRCAELGLDDRVAFRGFMPHKALRPWVERADVMVVSSRHEAGPLVMLEAAIAGVPTVGTAVGHIADWSPEASVAVPIGDSSALALEIERLASDENERLRLARAAQSHALTENADATARRTSGLYAELLGDFRDRGC